MAVCSLCGNVVEPSCTKCKYPDHMIERKFNKHGGKAPTKRGAGNPNAPYKWPAFKKGTKAPGVAEGDRVE